MKQIIWNIDISFEINSTSIQKDIETPSAHSLHTNWRYTPCHKTETTWSIILEDNPNFNKVSATIEGTRLIVKWSLDFKNQKGFNTQFLTTGNKWIVSKFISHLWEINRIISLHACGIYHPKSWKVIIGIWTSWSWKTALISSAIENGWLIISTEMLQVNEKGIIIAWNQFDVIWKPAEKYFQKNSHLSIPTFSNDTIFDQTGSKSLADFSKYSVPENFTYSIENAELVFLQFGNNQFSKGQKVIDDDMSLRFITHAASEKIEAPTYLGNDIMNINMYWDSWFRNKIIHLLQSKIMNKKILGWNIDDFNRYLNV